MDVRFNLDLKERLHIWEFPKMGEEYIAGIDSSEGVEGGDPSCIQVLNRKTFNQAAVWHGFIEPYDLGRIAYYLGYFYHGMLLAPERNSSGMVVIDCLRALNYSNIYRMQTFDYEVMDYTERLGWITTVHTRGLIIETLRDLVKDNIILINDPDTLAEMKTFIRNKKSGKIEAATGSHDDRVIALAIASYLNNVMPRSSVSKTDKSYLDKFRSRDVQKIYTGRGGY